jgi:hypothetical protein
VGLSPPGKKTLGTSILEKKVKKKQWLKWRFSQNFNLQKIIPRNLEGTFS